MEPSVDWQEYKANPTLEARNRIIEAYLYVAEYHASTLAVRLYGRVETAELVNMGVFGLIQAIGGFDPERGVLFATYAAPRIRGAILDALREHDWVPRLVRRRKETPVRMSSLNARRFDSDRGVVELADLLPNDKATDPTIPLDTIDEVHGLTRCLSNEDLGILWDHFGEDVTYREIADVVGVHFSRINQRLVEILKRVRRWILKKDLEI